MDYFKELEIHYTTEDSQHMEMEEELVIFAGAERIVYNPDYSTGILTRFLDKNWKRIGPGMQKRLLNLFEGALKTELDSGCNVDQLKVNYLKQFLEVHNDKA